MQADVSILIVTHNSAHEIGACLDSLGHHSEIAHELIVVDNASTDSTTEILAQAPGLRLVVNAENSGFAASVNQAARLAKGRYLLLLNPDTVVDDNAIDRLVAFMDAHPDAGICAPRILDVNGCIRHNCFSFETPWSFFWFGVGVGPLRRLRNWMLRGAPWDVFSDQVQEVEAVIGAALLVRRELFVALNGLDERFFMYCEDDDFCWRAQQAGWKRMLVPDAVIIHVGGASAPEDTVYLNGMIGRYLLQSRYRYTEKYWSRLTTWGLRLAYALAGILFWLGSFFLLSARMRRASRQHGRQLLMTPLSPSYRGQP